jgi:hypothetical protein
MSVGSSVDAVAAAGVAAQASYQQHIDNSDSRKEGDKIAVREDRDFLKATVRADRRHREQIEAEGRGGVDIDV